MTERRPALPIPAPLAGSRTPRRPGRVLGGRYRLVRLVAIGGMAQVWEAVDESLRRTVAVKLLHDHLRDERTIARFRREAIAVARMRHPGIVAIYDTIRDDGFDGIVMELVEGETLRDLLDREAPLAVARATRIALAVCDALGAAHAAGIVHRDIKPGNVLIAPGDVVKLTDFGIAKLLADIDLTMAGSFVGTAKYVSPEQVQGRTSEPRSDVYATTAMFYEMVCGVAPFEGDSDASVALARLHRDPLPPSARRPGLTPALDRLVRSGMARRPEDRIASAAHLALALRGLGDETALAMTALDAKTVAGSRRNGTRTPSVEPEPTQAFNTLARGADSDDSPADGSIDDPGVRVHRRSSLVLLPLAVAAIVGLVVSTALIAGSTTGRNLWERLVDAGGEPMDRAVSVSQARAFDPAGDGREHDDRALFVLDRNPETSWTTESYSDRRFGRLKEGVGLVLELERSASIDDLQIVTNRRGWSAEVFVADGRPASLEGFGTSLTTVRSGDLRERVKFPDATRGRAILIWITDLGEGPSPISLEIREIAVTARAR